LSSFRYVFGPVPSRRLGRSLGINNIPPKYCSYSCVYCQVGRTRNLTTERREFIDFNLILNEAASVIDKVGGENIDYITIVPDGEPTLDINLGKLIDGLRNITSIKLAVLTNSSLLYRQDVREDLYKVDLVSVKVDTVDEEYYRRINRPHPSIRLSDVLEGIKIFSREYGGKVISETMVIDGINDKREVVTNIAEFLADIDIDTSYIAIPTRPPAENWVKPASEKSIVEAYEIFVDKIGKGKVELLIGYEGSDFTLASGDIKRDILGIIAVHPLRLDYFREIVEKRGLDPNQVLSEIIDLNLAKLIDYRGHKFLIRSFRL